MRRALLLSVLAAALLIAPAPHAAAQAKVQRGSVHFSSVVEWQGGLAEGIQITNNDNGEIRLADGKIEGTYTSGLTKTDFPANALGAVWQASVPAEAELRLEARGGPTPETLGDWQQLPTSDARSQSADGAFATESLIALPEESQYLQVRASFKAKALNASPVVQELELSYLNGNSGPTLSPALTRVAAPFGPATLTPAPQIIPRADWSGAAASPQISRQAPHGIIIHQIGSTAAVTNTLSFLRAVASYQAEVLGWGDLSYHFVVGPDGDILQGQAGGPTASIPRFAGGDDAIHIALVGGGAASEAQQRALASLIAWLGEAFEIAPLGQHSVANGSGTSARANVAAHSEAVPGVADPSAALAGQIASLRQAADTATVRSRWYFAEGNTFNYQERLSVLNTSASTASVRFRLLRQPGPAEERTVTLQGNGRYDLQINSIFSDTTDVPAIVEANQPIIAERFMDFQTDITTSPGVQMLQRVWYFAEGSTDGSFKTYLALFNPQATQVSATLTYMKGDGTTAEQKVEIPPMQRSVVAVDSVLPGVGFGTRVIASQPIVAERTMIFGPGSTTNSGGVHTAPGVAQLAQRWYFAEGTTQPPFTMAVLVLNPNAQPANVAVTFSNADGVSLTRRYAVPPTSRLAINVNEFVPQLGVATVIESDRPVAAERAMYWRDTSVGTVTPGTTTTSYTWRFADGRTSDGFQEYLLFNNPSKNQARVTVDFVLADGSTAQQGVVMPGSSRYTMAVHQLYPGQRAISATVRATQPIIAERSLFPSAPTDAGNRGGASTFGVPER
ncbi:N-acetylmuramoyl-L-alanine amidase [Chloroflexia bacterium SDU3-3]|nr:N-acetylmuramoyl-L-alanine amidase [Chloroflexia bacterium SDU3-3]